MYDSVSIWIEVWSVAFVTSVLRVYLPIAGVIDEIEHGDALGTWAVKKTFSLNNQWITSNFSLYIAM